MPRWLLSYRHITRPLWRAVECITEKLLWPLNQCLALALRHRVMPNSVLHVCYPVHIVHYTVELLRAEGFRADYLALGDSMDWTRCDYRLQRWAKWVPLALVEFWCFWTIMARYQIVQLHFMAGISDSGWEWPLLRRMGRKIVVYYSGCEIRERDRNMALHPEFNICQQCDYDAVLCTGERSRHRRDLSRRYADLELLTTPDMRDFVPHGIHFPFFAPPPDIIPPRTRPTWPENGCFRIVHATNHPGIEGTEAIAQTVDRLKEKGLPIEFHHLRRTPYAQVLAEFADADLSIGKMKMGYYANAQIEAMCCGTPTISWVRPDLIDDAVRNTGLVLAELSQLEYAIEALIASPEDLERRRRNSADQIRHIHDNKELAQRLIAMYHALTLGENTRSMTRFDGLRPAKDNRTRARSSDQATTLNIDAAGNEGKTT